MSEITGMVVAGVGIIIVLIPSGKYVWQRFVGDTASGKYDSVLEAAHAAEKELSKPWSERI